MGCRKNGGREEFRSGGIDARLRINELELVSAVLFEVGAGLGADAKPVDSFRGWDCSVGLNGDFEFLRVKGLDQGRVKLQQGFAAGADYEFLARSRAAWLFLGDSVSERPADSNFPPPGPLVSAKSVSQNLQIAEARSASRPDQRLQPAKRQKTAARPVCAPSPCRV